MRLGHWVSYLRSYKAVRPETDLQALISRLESLYGPPDPPVVTDPFEMVLWENVAYLVDDERRARVFARLREEVGLDPEDILTKSPQVLAEIIRDGGMQPERRAEKLIAAADEVLPQGVEALRELVRTAPEKARKRLQRFPGIGEPGADKILLFSQARRTLAADSNALRVLVRVGFGQEDENYGRMYRSAAEAVAPQLPEDFPWLIRAHQLLRRHGQEICRRGVPLCEACPLTSVCRWFLTRSTPHHGGARVLR
jgi:endonuclease-3